MLPMLLVPPGPVRTRLKVGGCNQTWGAESTDDEATHRVGLKAPVSSVGLNIKL